MLQLQLSKQAIKFIRGLPPKQMKQVKNRIKALMLEPTPHDSKQLIGFHPYKRISIGEYRIIYKIEKNVIIILLVGKRNDSDVYKKLKRAKNL